MTTRRVSRFMLFLAAAVSLPGAVLADWPNFRGSNYDGISTETTFKKEHDGSLTPVWERDVGSAFSSFAAVGDRVYTCGLADGQETLLCLNAESGDVVWRTPIGEAFRNEFGDGTRATPTVHDGNVYILGALGRLMCVKADTGELVWDRTFTNKPTWAYAGSVLIEGDLAVASGGNSDGALVALDKRTGKEVWRCDKDAVGYAMPYPFTFEGKRYIAGFMADTAIMVEATTGKRVWRMPWKTSWDVNASMPIVAGDKLFLSSGYDTGCGLYQLSMAGSRLKTDEIWRSKVLLNKFQSCVLYQGHLYTSDQKSFKCVDFATGDLKWEQRGTKHSPLMLADGYIIMLTEDGELQIGEANPKGFEAKTKAKILSGRCWSVPVLHEGRLYARNLETVKCFDLR